MNMFREFSIRARRVGKNRETLIQNGTKSIDSYLLHVSHRVAMLPFILEA